MINTLPAVSWKSVADLLHDLGDIPSERVRMDPQPGRVTFDELVAANETRTGQVCEWVDGTLVEKATGWFESFIAMNLIGCFYGYLETHPIGLLLGPDAVLRILPKVGRAADVAFVSLAKFPNGVLPIHEKIPALVPDLVVEVLSESNTKAEMQRKRDEYFRAGVLIVWEIDPESRTANVYTAPETFTTIDENGTLDGGTVMPGFQVPLRQLFTIPGQPVV